MEKRPRHAWMLLVLFPLGFGAWVPLVAGLRALAHGEIAGLLFLSEATSRPT